MSQKPLVKGFVSGCLAFSLWGILPLYWRILSSLDPLHILSFRIIMSLILVAIILLAAKNKARLEIFKTPLKAAFMIMTAVVLCFNWGLYIQAVNRGHTLDASLGYYINPLVSVLLGLIFYRERLLALQWIAVALAAFGVFILTIFTGAMPWTSLALAVSFGIYGLLKKKSPLSALESLGAETLVSVPIALLLLCFGSGGTHEGSPLPLFLGLRGLSYLSSLSPHTWIFICLSGIVSALPLYLFAQSAKLLPLSALGFAQFISPTLQFFIGIFIFGESFPSHHFAAFIFIWAAVAVYIISLKTQPDKK